MSDELSQRDKIDLAGCELRTARGSELRRARDFARAVVDRELRARGIEPWYGAPGGRDWERESALQAFLQAQPGARFVVCERAGELIAVARTTRFETMDEALEVVVAPEYSHRGLGRALLAELWSGTPTPDLGRLAVVPGTTADLNLYLPFGVMPVAGRWHLRIPVALYRERRAAEVVDEDPAPVHVLETGTALETWAELEEGVLGYARPWLHEWFARDRVALGVVAGGGTPDAVCWVSAEGDVGPAVARRPEDLVPVVLAALDRVASACEAPELAIQCTTPAWWLLRRLRLLGFRLHWPSWILSSVPCPALDRYLPVQPPALL